MRPFGLVAYSAAMALLVDQGVRYSWLAGVPTDFVKPGELGLWPLGVGLRGLAYLVCGAFLFAPLAAGPAQKAVAAVIWAAMSILYWFACEPLGWANVLAPAGASRIMMRFAGTPILGEIYWGQGAGKYMPLLLALHSVLTVGFVLIVRRFTVKAENRLR